MSSQTTSALLVGEGSHSSSPDLDWSQVRETVKMLNLVIAHLGGSQMHGDDSVNELTSSFTSMADALTEIRNMIGDAETDQDQVLLNDIDQKCELLSGKVHGAIIAFQFYDRFSQNLSHVNQCLASLGDLVADQTRLYNPLEWTKFQSEIRGRYTMAEEREMFDMVINGLSIDEVLGKVKAYQNEDVGEIELF